MALVATLVLVAVPLYLWRRPQPESIPSADAAVASATAVTPPFVGPDVVAPSSTAPALEIAPVKTLKCQDPGPGRTPPERCDGIRALEDAFTRAIKESRSCAPTTKSSFVMSYVLEANFSKKRTNIFLGKSTTLAKSRRRALLRCVEKAFATPEWDRIPHQHQKYTLNTIVTYPPSNAADPQPGAGELPDTPRKKKSTTTPKKSAPKSKSHSAGR
jgi:hypothetical protein